MIKLVALALIGLVGGSAAFNEELEKETGLLMGNEKLFSNYCMDSRRYVVADFKAKASESSSAIFNAFFGAATEIADEVLKVERQAVEELSKKIAWGNEVSQAQGQAEGHLPEEPEDDEPLDEDYVRALMEDGKRALAASRTSSPTSRAVCNLVASTMTAAQVMINAANSALFVRLGKLRTLMNGGNLVKGISHTCQQVAEYERKLESDLEEAKVALKGDHSEPEVQRFIEKVTVAGLKCHTTKFISRVHAFCELFKEGNGAFFKMLGLSPQYANTIKENL